MGEHTNDVVVYPMSMGFFLGLPGMSTWKKHIQFIHQYGTLSTSFRSIDRHIDLQSAMEFGVSGLWTLRARTVGCCGLSSWGPQMMGPWQWLRFKCHQPCHQPVPGKNHGNIEMLGMFENMSNILILWRFFVTKTWPQYVSCLSEHTHSCHPFHLAESHIVGAHKELRMVCLVRHFRASGDDTHSLGTHFSQE